MLVVAVAWIYVVLMMAVAEATSPNGTLLGALFTVLLYGVLPLSIALYLIGTPRRRARRGALEPDETARAGTGAPAGSALDPDGGGHPPGDAVAPVRKET